MRFYEYEAKELFKRHGMPLGKGTVIAKTNAAADARAAFAKLGGIPVVLKSQVLSGGRMKAGAVKFADTADEAADAAEAIVPVEVNGQICKSILVEEKSPIAQEYFVAITWDGRAKRPVCVFSDMGGIDIEEVAETHPEHVSKTHFSSILPLTPRIAKEAVGATGVTGSDLNKLAPIVFNLMKIFLKYDLTLAEINPLAKLEDGRFIVLDGHIDMEAEARGEHKALLDELGIGDDETRLARPPTPFELAGAKVNAADHRGVAGNVVEFDGNLGLVIEKIAVMMNVVSNTRVDIVARGVIKGCLEAGKDPAETIAIFRIPGAWEEEGFKILEKYGVDYCDRSVSMYDAAGRAVAKLKG